MSTTLSEAREALATSTAQPLGAAHRVSGLRRAVTQPVTLLLVLSLASVSLAAYGLGRHSLWLDEVMSTAAVDGSWASMWRFFLQLPEQHPAYYVVLRGWVWMFGSSDIAVRALSAVFAPLTLWALYPLARRLSGERVARIACVLMCFSPFALYYAQEARMYSMLGFLATLGTLLFLRCLEEPRWSRLAVFVGVSVIGAYTHLYYVFLMASLGLYVLVVHRRRLLDVWRILAAFGVIALSYLPWAALILVQDPATQSWKGPANVVFGIPYTLLRFALGYSEMIANYQWKARAVSLIVANLPLLAVTAVSCGILLIAGTRDALRRGPRGLVVIAALVGPMVLAVLVSLAVIVIGERYFIIVLPFFATLLAMGIHALDAAGGRSRIVGRAATTLYAGAVAIALVHYYTKPDFGKEQWEEVATLMRSRSSADDLVVLRSGYVDRAFRRYYEPPPLQRIVKSETAPAELLQSAPRLWLVLAHSPDAGSYLANLTRERAVEAEWLLPHQSGIRVVLLGARDAALR